MKPAYCEKNTGRYDSREALEDAQWVYGEVTRIYPRFFSVKITCRNGASYTESHSFLDIGKNVVLL